LNLKKVQKYWGVEPAKMDYKIIKAFFSLHPLVFKDWLPKGKSVYQTDLNYELTKNKRNTD
jgi:hypothetical protein